MLPRTLWKLDCSKFEAFMGQIGRNSVVESTSLGSGIIGYKNILSQGPFPWTFSVSTHLIIVLIMSYEPQNSHMVVRVVYGTFEITTKIIQW